MGLDKTGKVKIIIEDRDIATIEALHDILLERGLNINSTPLKRARYLTNRMYKAFKK